jgi:hypothetical protein
MSFYSSGGHDEIILGNVRLVRATRQPCPVCGHPTGDCAGPSLPPQRILLHGVTPSLEEEQLIYVEEDIFEERRISEFTTVRVLLARKGSSVSFEKARELGLL